MHSINIVIIYRNQHGFSISFQLIAENRVKTSEYYSDRKTKKIDITASKIPILTGSVVFPIKSFIPFPKVEF